MVMNKLVSIVMPTYNAEKYLREAVDSIWQQTYENWELLVIDDDSTDSTLTIMDEYAKEDKRIRVLQGSKQGIAAALNYGISQARGEYIARMDADDIALPERIEKQISYMEKHKDIGVCGTNFVIFDDSGLHINKEMPKDNAEIAPALIFSNIICHPSVIFRKATIECGYHYDEHVVAEDYDLWLRMLPKVTFHTIQEPLMYYRANTDSLSHTKKRKMWLSAVENTQKAVMRIFEIDVATYAQEVFSDLNSLNFEYMQVSYYKFLVDLIRLFSDILSSNNEKNIFQQERLMEVMQKRWEKILSYLDKDWKRLPVRAGVLELLDITRLINAEFPVENYMDKLKKYIDGVLPRGKKYAIYGMGANGEKVLKRYLKIRKDVILFDKKVTSVEVNGAIYPVYRLERLKDISVDGVLIASDYYFDEIKEELLQIGMEENKIFDGNIVWVIE